ncbi:MAG: PAS domain-containing protein [Bacteroidetes bacterium]|nr:MAG: PAS domain-containing protein [Bacteroidota bacterium]
MNYLDKTKEELIDELKKLRVENNQFRELFEIQSDALFVLSLEFVMILEANNSAVLLYGYSHEELLTMNAIDLSAEQALSARTKTDNSGKVPIRYHRKKDGTIFPVEITFNDFIYLGQPARIASVRDITERIQAEESLKASEEKFSSVFQYAPLMMAISDFDSGVIIDVNQNHLVNSGYTYQELIGKSSLEVNLIAPADRKFLIEKIKTNGFVQNEEILLRKKDNSTIHGLYSGFIIHSGGRSQIVSLTHNFTEQKQAEAELRESESRFRILADTAPVLIWQSGTDALCNYFNRPWLEFTGRTLEQEMGNGWAEGVHPDDFQTCLDIYLNSFAERKPFKMEYRLRRADGEYRWLLDHGIPRFAGEGVFLGYIGSCFDISETKLAQEKLLESEREFHLLAEAMPQIVWVCMPDGKNIYFNQQWVEYTGMTLEESYGDGWNSPFHPDEQQMAWDAWQNAVLNLAEYQLECRLRRADGTYTWWLIRGVPVFNEHGAIDRWFGTCTDIDKFKIAQDALKKREQQFKEVLETSLDASYKRDLISDSYDYISPVFDKITGYTQEEFKSMPIKDTMGLIHPDDHPGIDRVIAESNIDRHVNFFQVEYRFKRKDGNYCWLHDQFTTIRDAEGKAIARIGSVSDITERKMTETALLKSKQQFDKLAANIPVGVYVLHSKPDGTFKLDYVSPPMAEMLGKSIESLLEDATNVFKSIHPDDLPDVVKLNDDGIRLIQPFDWTGRIVSDGEIKWMHFRSLPEILDNGDVLWHGLITDITKEKLAEDAINEAHNRLLKIASRVPGVVYQYKLRPDGTSCFPYASEGIREIYGVSPEEVREDASKVFAVLHPDDLADVAASIQVSAKELSPWKAEYRVKFDDGTVHTVLGNAVPQMEADGSVLWHGFITNITDRKLIEVALAESREMYKILAENSSDGVSLIDPEGKVTYISPAYVRRLGYTAEEWLHADTKRILSSLHPDDAPRIADEIKRGRELKLPVSKYEYRMLTKSGEYIWLEDVLHRSFDEQGNFIHTVVNSRIITERKQLEEILKESEYKFRNFFENSLVGKSMTTIDGYLEVNKSFCDILGYSITELAGLRWQDITHPDDIEDGQIKINSLLSFEKNTERFEKRYIRKDGQVVWADLSTSLQCDSAGKPLFFITAIIDITRRKQIEEEIRNKNGELAKTLSEKDKFFSIIAHDLRGPFNGFLGLTQLMAEDIESMAQQDIKKIAGRLNNSAVNLFALLNNLLEWARMQQGITKFEPKTLSLFPFATSILQPVLETANKKGIEVIIDITENLEVIADENMLSSTIRNLASNAIKFTPSGGKVSLSAKPTMDGKIVVSVKDSGIGMDKEILDKMFKLDTNLSRKGTDGEPSTGLGLLLCKDFIGKHGGEIWVKSEVNKGSTFYFTLPYTTQPAEETVNSQPAPSKQENNLRKLKILIAEDDEISEMLINSFIKSFGKEILKARTGVETVEMFRANPDIDLILMDNRMPLMSGYEATKQIRQFNKDVIIIAQTTYVLPGDREKSLEAGCNDYITKPIKKAELQAVIHKYFWGKV